MPPLQDDVSDRDIAPFSSYGPSALSEPHHTHGISSLGCCWYIVCRSGWFRSAGIRLSHCSAQARHSVIACSCVPGHLCCLPPASPFCAAQPRQPRTTRPPHSHRIATGQLKPDLIAPGAQLTSAASSDGIVSSGAAGDCGAAWLSLEGTSMAASLVGPARAAPCCAVLFQAVLL